MDGISNSELSRIRPEMDERIEGFQDRPLEGQYPYIWLNAKPLKVHHNDRLVNMAAVIAVGVKRTGKREVLGLDVGATETREFQLELLLHLLAPGDSEAFRWLFRKPMEG